MNQHCYIPQSAFLKSVIRSIWQVDGKTQFQSETIIPKGVAEIIFDFSETTGTEVTLNNKTFKLPRCLINGFNTSNINRQLPFHQVNFGIQFHPAAIHKLFGFHGHEFSNLAIDVTLIDATFQTLWYQLAEQSEFEHRVSIIANWLQQKKIELHPQEILLSSFLESKGPPVWTVLELSNLACYSPRHLSRKMIELTGMNAETILLYKKYLNAVQLIHHHKMTLTEIAYSSNFSDQSHFTRSFKLFAQSTPSEYLRKMSFVPGHIFENVR